MIEYCDISKRDLELLLKGDKDYWIHFHTYDGTEVIIKMGDCDSVLEEFEAGKVEIEAFPDK